MAEIFEFLEKRKRNRALDEWARNLVRDVEEYDPNTPLPGDQMGPPSLPQGTTLRPSAYVQSIRDVPAMQEALRNNPNARWEDVEETNKAMALLAAQKMKGDKEPAGTEQYRALNRSILRHVEKMKKSGATDEAIQSFVSQAEDERDLHLATNPSFRQDLVTGTTSFNRATLPSWMKETGPGTAKMTPGAGHYNKELEEIRDTFSKRDLAKQDVALEQILGSIEKHGGKTIQGLGGLQNAALLGPLMTKSFSGKEGYKNLLAARQIMATDMKENVGLSQTLTEKQSQEILKGLHPTATPEMTATAFNLFLPAYVQNRKIMATRTPEAIKLFESRLGQTPITSPKWKKFVENEWEGKPAKPTTKKGSLPDDRKAFLESLK